MQTEQQLQTEVCWALANTGSMEPEQACPATAHDGREAVGASAGGQAGSSATPGFQVAALDVAVATAAADVSSSSGAAAESKPGAGTVAQGRERNFYAKKIAFHKACMATAASAWRNGRLATRAPAQCRPKGVPMPGWPHAPPPPPQLPLPLPGTPCAAAPPLRRRPVVSAVLPQLLLSGKEAEKDVELLRELGVTHVLQIGVELRPSHDEERGFSYLSLPAYDLEDQDILSLLPKGFEFIDSAIKARGKVLVHCAAGVSRSASVCIAYLMRSERTSFVQAHARVKAARPIVAPNLGFCLQLYLFEAERWVGFEEWSKSGWDLDTFLEAKADVAKDLQERMAQATQHATVSAQAGRGKGDAEPAT
uniref:Protein-serine/threonine phosphatase n=1 Tax=Chlamydomonas euryale TaxID=1486919 RepID=A0A7R9YSG4_9CHLO|mmetsp:Transcript_17001/g.50967  ORF Transcript_17001/g.50967 Transcript_17001/m.50967 type:complete len:365 (+) Transcript_17001:226-1320(+)